MASRVERFVLPFLLAILVAGAGALMLDYARVTDARVQGYLSRR